VHILKKKFPTFTVENPQSASGNRQLQKSNLREHWCA